MDTSSCFGLSMLIGQNVAIFDGHWPCWTHGVKLHTWGHIAHMGSYCTHGVILHTLGHIAHMGSYCTHGVILHTWGQLHTLGHIAHMGSYCSHGVISHTWGHIAHMCVIWIRGDDDPN